MSYIKTSAILGSFAFLLVSTPAVIAQEGANALEEIVVTGRKREENLIDVPISISVWSGLALEEQGIDSQDELFASTVGLDYNNFNGGRGAGAPGIRGVQSDLRAANQQKVNSFIDGIPMQGRTGSLQFAGIDAVEVYRGPQSAAFGRSTFAGAINYVTSDASEEFTGKIQARVTDLGDNEVAALVSGPLGDSLGYRISYVKGENSGPNEWLSTDGFELNSTETDSLTAKLNFEFSDTVYGEVMYSRLETNDVGNATFAAAPGTCAAGSGIWRNNMGADVELPSGSWDCPLDTPAGGIPRNNDALGSLLAQYDANIGFYTAAAQMGADTNMDGLLQSSEYLAQTLADGQTYEQAILGVTPLRPFNDGVRERFAGELNFEFGDSLLSIFGMYVDEGFTGWGDGDGSDTLPVIVSSFNMMTMATTTALQGNVMAMGAMNVTTESYIEARWVSPEEDRLRYTLSASFYDYDFFQPVVNNFGAIVYGLTLPDGTPVDPNNGIIISDIGQNIGLAFGLQYDLTDNTTLSFEGRYSVDETCGTDDTSGFTECQETKAFLPRFAINTALGDNTSVYAQASKGNNPGGVNVAYANPGVVEALAVAAGRIPVPAAPGAINAGTIYDGSDGVHFPEVAYDETTFTFFDEETLWNFEIGAKGTFADGRGAYTAAVYYMIYNDIVSAENLNWDNAAIGGWNEGDWSNFDGARTWLNQGDSEMFGLELDANFAVNEIWTVGGYITLSSAKFTDFCSIEAPQYRDAPGGGGGGGSFVIPILTPDNSDVTTNCGQVEGNWVPRQTPFTGNLNVSASLPNDVFGLRTSIRADVRHKGAYYEDDLNLIERDAVTTVNASINMRNENWNIRLFVNNLTNNIDPLRISPGNFRSDGANPTLAALQTPTWSIVPQRPREVGLQVGYQF